MAGRQRARGPKKERSTNQLADLGIFNIPDFEVDDDVDESDVDESALESELEAILTGKAASKPARPKKKVAPTLDIEQMAAECMKDIGDDDDDDISDPDLLKELIGLSCENLSPEPEDIVPEVLSSKEDVGTPERNIPGEKPAVDILIVLEERLNLYHNAIEGAKALNDISKVRRFGRAVKSLEKLIKSAKSGVIVNEEEIPPVVNIPKATSHSQLPCDTDHDSTANATNDTPVGNLIDISCDTEQEIPKDREEQNVDEKNLKSLMIRRDEYRLQALQAKRAGDKDTAMQYIKISKTFDAVIEALNKGESVDLSNVPPPPPPYQATIAPSSVSPSDSKREHDETQTSSAIEAAALSAASEPEDPTLFAAPPAPASILEALEQRLAKYNATKAAAEAEGPPPNNSKIRRLQRIVKSYEKAIKDYKAHKEVNFEELPTPPGFAPIPVQTNAPQEITPSAKEIEDKHMPNETEATSTVIPKRPAPQVPSQSTEQRRERPKVQRTNTSTLDKQLEFLLERQKMFRQAAISSKREGNIQQAKEYLRMSKGFDSMIEATRSGLPIDASSIPTPPQLESNDFVVVDISECVLMDEDESSIELLNTLEKDLMQQIEVCTSNKEHFLRLGDISTAHKFEKLGIESKKDLSVIRHLQKTGQNPPKFHYETRLFSMVQCHTDISDNDLIVTVERGVNLPGKPDDLDSYVKLDFPIPSETPQRAKTHTVRDTNNPIFEEEFKFEINRKSRAQLRQFKRQALKLEVWSKVGFLRSDALLGTVAVKLQDLESKCTIHDCFDLMDGRKHCGGKLEVKVKLRQPLLVKQVEEVREKWLVIGS